MNRNLSKRVELLTPVEDKEARKRLHHILETHFADTARGRTLKADGTWHSPASPPRSPAAPRSSSPKK
jgi:polyphosphate kinase